MAKWDRIISRGDVEDRRGISAGMGGAGLLVTLVVIGFQLFAGNGQVDVSQVLQQLQAVQPSSGNVVQPEQFQGSDAYEVFVSAVLGSNNDTWRQLFENENKTYVEPRLVLYRDGVNSGCGFATSQSGPFYCPSDKTIYIDETFFEELEQRFGAQGGDVAEAYVISHEVGHHVQNLEGSLGGRQSNEDSVKTELQSDCYAGIWAYSLKGQDVFEPGEFDEAIDAAAAVGDDRIQSSTGGGVNPETWTHGSSEDRKYWLNRGFETGDPAQCRP